jgi:hypothetical protein
MEGLRIGVDTGGTLTDQREPANGAVERSRIRATGRTSMISSCTALAAGAA